MHVSLAAVVPARDRSALIEFLATNRFPFPVRPAPTREQAGERVDARFAADDVLAFRVVADFEDVGLLVIEDADDPSPLLDLRLAESRRGRGIGTAALRLGIRALFEARADTERFEAQTRVDNLAMRRVLERCGFVKEAHYRRGWPVEGQAASDSIGYALRRTDWESGTTTPVPWDA